MKALILNGKVMDTASTEFEVHPSMTWVDCDDTVKGGYSYGPEKPGKDGVTFILISNGGPIDLNWSDIKKPPIM